MNSLVSAAVTKASSFTKRAASSNIRKGMIASLLFAISLAAHSQVPNESIQSPIQSPIQSIESLIRSKHYQQALQETQSKLSGAPQDYHLWALQGIVLSLQGQDQQALDAFDKALAISPNYPAALKAEAQLLYRTQDKRAIPILERILARDAKDLTAHEMLAMVEQKQGDCAGAVAHFLASSERVATHPASLEAYGRCLAQTGQQEKAIPVFAQLAALLPERSYPKYDVALLMVQTRQYEAALKLLGPLVAADPSDPEILSLASDACEATGDTPKAVSLLRQAIVLSPLTAGYYTRFAALSLNHDSFQVGIDMVDAGLQRLPGEPALYISRGLLYAQLAEYDRAEADFRKAEQLDAKQSVTSFALDLSQLQRNNPEAAIAQVRSQLKIHGESPLLHYLLAKLLFDQGSTADSGNLDEALRSALTAIQLKPDLVEARDLLANIYLRSGKYELAEEESRRALEYDPADQVAVYHLILALRHANSPQSREQIQALVKRLSDAQTAARQEETDRKRFKFEEQTPPTQP
jgi:tetratricopeptide (TPR) repeat protein